MSGNRYTVSNIDAPKRFFPPMGLTSLVDRHGHKLVMSKDPFGPHIIVRNDETMRRGNSVLIRGKIVNKHFRFPLTYESMERVIADYNVVSEKTLIPGILHLGRTLVLPGRSLVVNPPKDDHGRYITDNRIREYISKAKESDGVLFSRDGFSYVQSFDVGNMSFRQASSNGLVRALIGPKVKTLDLSGILSKANSPLSINISGIDNVSVPTLKLAIAYMDRDGESLYLEGDRPSDTEGFVYGVLDRK